MKTNQIFSDAQRSDISLDEENSTREFEKIETDESTYPVLSEFEALKTVLNKSIPYAATRLIFALNTMGIAWTVSKLGATEVAAGSFSTSLQYLLVGIPQGIMLSAGIPFGEKNGAGDFSEVGKISRASWKLAVISSIISIGALLSSPSLLSTLGLMSEDIKADVQDYLNYYSIAVPAVLASIAEQQIAVALKDPKVTLGFIAIYSGIASGLGIPMSLGLLGKSLSGTKGYGIATAISSWCGLLAMRLYYYLNKDYEKYQLFKLSYTSKTNYLKDLLSLGWKFGAQAGSEFANLMATSLLFSSFGNYYKIPALQIAAPAMQIASAWGLVSIGLGQAQANLIANERGIMKKSFQNFNLLDAENARQNIIKLGRQGMVLGTFFTAILGAVCIFTPSLITQLFLSDDVSSDYGDLANKLVQIGSSGLLLDTLRNLYAGNLKGFRDVNFSTIVSFLLMTIMFVAAGIALLSQDEAFSPLMWFRNIGIFLSTAIIAIRWFQFSNMSLEKHMSLDETLSNKGIKFDYKELSNKAIDNESSSLLGTQDDAVTLYKKDTSYSVNFFPLGNASQSHRDSKVININDDGDGHVTTKTKSRFCALV